MPERKVAYETVRNQAHPTLLLESPSLQRLFIDAGLAMTDSLVSLDLVKDSLKEVVIVTAESKEACLTEWLNQVLKLMREKQFLARRIVFNQFSPNKIEAALFGDKYEPTRHGHLEATQAQTELNLINDGENNFSAKITLIHQRTDKP